MYDFLGYLILALFFAVNLIISLVTRNYLIDKDYKTRYMPLLVIAFLIVALDASKQIRGLLSGYDKTIIPLYFCSFFNILYPLAAFSKGKIKQVTQIMSSIYSFVVMLGLYLFPRMMIGESAYAIFGGFKNFHTFTYHHLVMLYGMLSISLQLVDLNTKENLIALVFGAIGYTLIGGPSAAILKVNFHNFYPTDPGFITNLRLAMGTPLFITMWGAMFAVVMIPGYFIFKVFYQYVANRRVAENTDTTLKFLR